MDDYRVEFANHRYVRAVPLNYTGGERWSEANTYTVNTTTGDWGDWFVIDDRDFQDLTFTIDDKQYVEHVEVRSSREEPPDIEDEKGGSLDKFLREFFNKKEQA